MTDTLDKLRKAFQQAISTYDTVQPWNEPLRRREAVQSSDQSLSAPIVQGGLGGWVGSSGFPYTATTADGIPLGVQAPGKNLYELGLGLPGVPDVDFVPYAARTNRFGGKGPALLGHPISWEVVGPTLKSPFCDWQWNVNLGANTLTLEAGPNPMPGTALPVDLSDAYGLGLTITPHDIEGGLYVLFSFTGENFNGSLTGGRTPITPVFKYKAPFEIFRVLNFQGYVFTLRMEKLLTDFYGAGDGCRAITLLRPKVTRLVPFQVPISGKGQRNQTFVFVPPQTSARSEYMPPFNSPAATGTWSSGGFDVSGTINPGSPNYGTSVAVPVPKPIATLDATIPVGGPYAADQWVIETAVSSSLMTAGRIVRVTNLFDDPTTNLQDGGPINVFGYFEIDSVVVGPPDTITLRRVVEANPDTGAVFFGGGPTGTAPVPIRVEIFDPVSSLFSGPLSLEQLMTARLSNLIDPRTAGPSVDYRDTSSFPVPPSKPDRAIFDTRPGADPGNLLDLGFRTVFYPAKLVGGNAVPDYDKPIDSNEVLLDPSVTAERQFIEMDYSSGVAYASHPPSLGTSQLVPVIGTVNAAANNPRNEVVVFAACVPYSMEDGQTGTGIRVTGGSSEAARAGFGVDDLADVFGRRIITQPTVLQTINPPGLSTLVTTLGDLTDIPAAGFFFVAQNVGGVLTNRAGPFTYQYTTLVGPNVQLNGISGPGAVNVDPTTGWYVVLQRAYRSFDPSNSSSDAVKGSAKRLSTLAFKNASFSFSADGSVTVSVRPSDFGLDNAYREDSATPGIGRVIVADGGPVELRPTGSSTDPTLDYGFDSQMLARSDFGSGATISKVGYDFIGRRTTLPYTGGDNYAGYIDRRVFAPQTGHTILGAGGSYLFDISTAGTDQISITTGGNQFHDGTNKTSLVNDLDLIQIPGFGLYILHAAVFGVATDYLVRNLDGTVPVLAAGAAIGCSVYRPRFQTGRGFNTGALLTTQGATWIAGQGPKPALRLFAGSAYVEKGPDDGGATTALEFWFRAGESAPTTRLSFDTYGRTFSQLAVQNLATQDKHYRGNYLSRQLINQGLVLTDFFSVGHITEEWTSGFKYGYDYLSLHAYDGVVYNITVAANNEFVIAGTAPDPLDMGALGGTLFVAIENLTLPTVATAANGLYVVAPSVTRDTGVPNLHFFVKNLAGDLTLSAGDTGLARFFVGSYLGKYQDANYSVGGTGFAESTHTPTVSVPLSKEANSVGIHIAGPDQTTRGPDARALRVTSTAETLIGPLGTQYQLEQFALDLQGNALARGTYDYNPVKVTTKKISAHGFFAENITSDLVVDPGAAWYYPNIGAGITSKNSPTRSNQWAKLDLSEVLPSGCIVTSIVFRVFPGAVRAAPADRMLFTLYRDNGTSALPTTLATTTDNGAFAEQDVTMTLGVAETLDYTSFVYWILVNASSGAVPADDAFYSATIHYKDPGPRN